MKNDAPTSAKMTIPLLKLMIPSPPTSVGDMVGDMVGAMDQDGDGNVYWYTGVGVVDDGDSVDDLTDDGANVEGTKEGGEDDGLAVDDDCNVAEMVGCTVEGDSVVGRLYMVIGSAVGLDVLLVG